MPNAVLAAALAYAADGHPVFPLQDGAKTPRLSRWQSRATIDAGVITDWWRRWPQSNVAILCGDRASYKLAVLDVDAKHGGSIPNWAPQTLTAHTPTGGWHLYYSVPLDCGVRNAVGIGGAAAQGLDVRADNGYVVAAPSVLDDQVRTRWGHLGPVEYRWDEATSWESATIATIDPALLMPRHLTDPLLGARQRRFEYRDEVPVGERNNYLTALAGYLFATGEDQAGVAFGLHDEASRLSFVPRADELEKIVRSVARYH